ncbi:MAG: bifunctional 4-hydroxy-3-methylbut-2-enyl diphosphate reductase/30S ribosomal protein S1 [Oscillospiraceae bacterium]|nr:bifunctional 4-hydroxy-3-methylbut-2-enyl diphosphate reductase/30S ribosomal protein S1 [Oscillospiraceae bacterium]
MSTITLAKTAGFCFGVARAVDTCDELLESGEKIVTLGPIIHNANVIKDLESRGVSIVNDPSEVPEGYTMVIRSHGVPDSVYDKCSQLGIKVADATCPFVRKIHMIVGAENTEHKDVIICGDRKHPEVEGIVGSCSGECSVFSTEAELHDIFLSKKPANPVIMVAQTTFNLLQYKEFSNTAKGYFSDIDCRHTICNATAERQAEAEELARNSDVCFVIGDRHSSNTKKLYDVCAKHCKVYLIENPHDLRLDMYKGAQHIGITAGASTPKAIIEEVFVRMSETTKIEGIGAEEELDFAQAIEESMPVIRRSARVIGTVTEVKQNEVIVDIGAKQTGVVPFDEFTDDSSADLKDLCKKGDEISLVVIKVNDQEGITTLSKKRADSQEGIALVEKAAKEGTPIEAYVSDLVNKGLIAKVKGVSLFVPASYATLRRGEPYEGLLHQNVMVKVIEFDPRKRRAIASIRDILQDEANKKREELWSSIEVGKEYEGTVKSLTNYGAFVDIGGSDGMVHVSELSWKRIRHPSEVVKVGDVIKVYVKELDPEKGRISLGYKRDEDNPWTIFKSQYTEGDEFEATVVSLTKFGAFLRIIPGVDGLVHISEISTERLSEPGEALSVGDVVKVKLIGIDEERNRVSLSIKQALSEEEMEEFNAKIEEKKAAIAERKARKAAKAAEKAAQEEAAAAAEEAPAEAAPAEEASAEETAPASEE